MSLVPRFVVLTLLALTGCSLVNDTVQLSATSGPLQIAAAIEPQPRAFGEGDFAVYADISITNVSGASAPVENACLKLSTEAEAGRAYQDTVASTLVDASSVELAAGETLRQRVYWVFKSKPAPASLTLAYECEKQPAAETPEAAIVVRGPTIVAFFDVTQEEVDEDEGLAEGLSDFQYYTQRASEALERVGVTVHARYSNRFTLLVDGKLKPIRVPEDEEGYCFVTAAGATHFVYGIGTDLDLMLAAQEYFGLDTGLSADGFGLDRPGE